VDQQIILSGTIMDAGNTNQTAEFPVGGDSIRITQIDYARLSKLVKSMLGSKSIDPAYLKFLNIELQKGSRVDSKQITPDFVTMNSLVRVFFPGSGKSMEIRLVYPQNANFQEGLVSVLSPLGCALLGYKAGDVVTFQTPKNMQKVKIEEVLYQPEAHGLDLE
jgi:regulator of nucleoside diphosphate kinase